MTTRTARLTVVSILISLLVGCGSIPAYTPPEGAGAYLQNRLVEVRDARFFHFFEYAGEHALEPTGINKAGNKTRVILKTNSPYDARYKISPGPTIVGVRVVFVPSFGRNMFARMNDRYYHVFVRDMGITEEQITYLSENLPHAEPADFSGMQGLEIDAVEGRTYLPNSRVENGRASVWIEDQDGTIVSQVVIGFGEASPDIRGALGELMGGSPFVDGLPDPWYGWDILTDLPSPP